jgi:1-acyl-sn-glycerol-3-phosphate acyltransferase
MVSNPYFNSAEYHTPQKKERALGDRLLLGTSIYFNICFLGVLFKNRRLANAGHYDTKQWAKSSYDIFRFLEDCTGKFHITGFDQVEKIKDEPVVFISNHMSTLETMVFPCLIAPFKEVTFVVKDSLLTNHLFGPIMRARNPIAVGRKDPRQDFTTVLNEGYKKLNQGTSVIIFPQSTRTIDFNPEAFNSLGIKLAQKAGVKVVPMAIKTDFWMNGTLFKDLGWLKRTAPIHICFGEPFSIKANGKEDHRKTVEFIQTNLENWNSSKNKK